MRVKKNIKKAIEAHPDLVNLDRPELFIKNTPSGD